MVQDLACYPKSTEFESPHVHCLMSCKIIIKKNLTKNISLLNFLTRITGQVHRVWTTEDPRKGVFCFSDNNHDSISSILVD
jgi:hypothetical protein